MATIFALPNEVVELVLWQIEDTQTLLSVSSVCKWLHSLSLRPLYNSYANPAEGGPNGLLDHENLRRFALTILEKPNFRCLVKKVRLGWRPDRSAQKLSSEDIQRYLQAGGALEFDDDDRDDPFRFFWKQAITDSRADAIAYLLLAHLPRLEELHITFDQAENDTAWDFLRRMGEQPSAWPYGALQTLRKVRLEYVIHEYAYEEVDLGATFEHVSSFFQIPSLRSCEMRYCNKGSMDDMNRLLEWTCPVRASAITTLDLTECCFSTGAITTLIDSCAALKHFRYIQGRNPKSYVFPNLVHLWLTLHKDSLESLVLYLGAEMWDMLSECLELDQGMGEGDVSLGPLHKFSKLQDVDVELKCFTGRRPFKPGRDDGEEEEYQESMADPPLHHISESLPPCLKTLRLRSSADFHPELLEKLFASPVREFPCVEDIHVEMEEGRYEELKQECVGSRLALWEVVTVVPL